MARSGYQNIAGAATTTVSTGKGVLVAIIVNKAIANGVITVYDNTTNSGTKIATITNPATLLHSQIALPYYRLKYNTGLTIVTSAADDITVIFE
jgi:hypothetical protein